MVIHVNDHHQSLNLLLFVRRAWGLVRVEDIPDLWPEPDIGMSGLPISPEVSVWEQRWATQWAMAWEWLLTKDQYQAEAPTQESMREATRPGQGLNPLVSPSWSREFGWEGIDKEAFFAWDRELLPDPKPSMAEHHNLPDLIEAWESGLDTVIVLPYVGAYFRRLSARHLAVSAQTRNDPESYSQALKSRI